MGEIDDGVFDWMAILDHKRRQKEYLREAERKAKESQRDVVQTNITTISHPEVLSPSVPQPHQGPLSPVSTNGLLSTPAKTTFEQNDTQNTQTLPAQPQAQSEPLQKEPVKKKKKWWKKLFFICRGSKE
jgi:hypothetical protein